jgi:glyceraldehyde-3-phosphate dehydrogenase type I
MPSKASHIRLGINGPGVIGRNLIRMFLDYPEFNASVSAINYHNNLPEKIAQSLKYDSIYGHWEKRDIKPNGKNIYINKEKIRFFGFASPEEIPWYEVRPDIVIDSSRVNNDPQKALGHKRNGYPKRIIITSAPKANHCPVIIYGVNHKSIDPKNDVIISGGTCSSNCLISTVKVLDDAFGIRNLFALTTHSQTGENQIYDRVQEGVEGRSISDNIVPSLTGATKTFFKVLPQLEEQLNGRIMIRANRVPISTGSVFDLTIKVKKVTTQKEVVEVFRQAASGSMKGVIGVVDDPITVADVRGLMHAAVIPTPYIEVLKGGKIIVMKAFYDNIRGFNSQIGRIVKYLAS